MKTQDCLVLCSGPAEFKTGTDYFLPKVPVDFNGPVKLGYIPPSALKVLAFNPIVVFLEALRFDFIESYIALAEIPFN